MTHGSAFQSAFYKKPYLLSVSKSIIFLPDHYIHFFPSICFLSASVVDPNPNPKRAKKFLDPNPNPNKINFGSTTMELPYSIFLRENFYTQINPFDLHYVVSNTIFFSAR
jgi:hypothetical protein